MITRCLIYSRYQAVFEMESVYCLQKTLDNKTMMDIFKYFRPSKRSLSLTVRITQTDTTVPLSERVSVEYLSCVRSGLLVCTGVGGPDMSDGVEHGAWLSLWTLLKEPWVM